MTPIEPSSHTHVLNIGDVSEEIPRDTSIITLFADEAAPVSGLNLAL